MPPTTRFAAPGRSCRMLSSAARSRPSSTALFQTPWVIPSGGSCRASQLTAAVWLFGVVRSFENSQPPKCIHQGWAPSLQTSKHLQWLNGRFVGDMLRCVQVRKCQAPGSRDHNQVMEALPPIKTSSCGPKPWFLP